MTDERLLVKSGKVRAQEVVTNAVYAMVVELKIIKQNWRQTTGRALFLYFT
jgi:hypothetical protein